jgi:protein TonB
LTALRGQLAQPNPEQPPSVDLARSRLAQGNIVTPDNDSALFYWNQLRAADPKNSNVTPLAEAIQAQILVQARAALDAAQVPKADALLQQAVTLGPSSALSSLGERLTQVKMASAPEVVKAPEVSESLLTRRNQVNLIYPDSADRQNIEGWVEVHYSVMTDGKVGQIAILAASPRGIFDAAATSAIGRMRYKPYLQDGKPIVVNTAVRLVFRQSKTAGPQ